MSSTNNILKTFLRSIVFNVKFGELIPGCRWGNEHVTFRFQSVFDIIFINKRLSHSEIAIFFTLSRYVVKIDRIRDPSRRRQDWFANPITASFYEKMMFDYTLMGFGRGKKVSRRRVSLILRNSSSNSSVIRATKNKKTYDKLTQLLTV